MKKQIIAAAIAAAVAAPAAMAGAPTVYGQVNMSIDNGKWENADIGTEVNSVASRIGVKGSEDLGNGLKAIYKLEWGVTVDQTKPVDVDGDGKGEVSGISGRNAYVGLAGSFGAVLLGRHDTPMKMSQPTDTFNDGYGDNKPMAGDLGMSGGEVRADNVLAYVSPSFSGVKFVLAAVPYEDGNKSALTNVISGAAMYGSKKKGLYLSGAYNNWTGRGAADDMEEIRVAAQYTAGALMGNIMYQDFSKTTNEGSNIQANVAYTLGAATLKAKYSMIDYKKTTSTKDGSGYGIGVDYALGKKTTAYVEYVGFDKNTLKYGESSVVSLGLLHKF